MRSKIKRIFFGIFCCTIENDDRFQPHFAHVTQKFRSYLKGLVLKLFNIGMHVKVRQGAIFYTFKLRIHGNKLEGNLFKNAS